VPSTPTRSWAARSSAIGCTVVTAASAPAHASAAKDWSSNAPTHSETASRSGAVPARRTTARTSAPRSASAAQTRAPTNPFAPVTTMAGADVDDSLMGSSWQGAGGVF
jgi:hypothetical protein